MKLKTDEPFVPENIRVKINKLQALLDQAADLYNDIYEWYDRELKSYNPNASADDELFDPGTGTVVEGIRLSGGHGIPVRTSDSQRM
ncbi:hypothetical protein [Faecalicatena contorta]|uniref:hypothetical protein n=1 Tax=Faecalicatena contorta TaxID=39482 RepID=UPI00204828A7|nr:MAG TPA: hypothetical protein [Caudoviricetes sp.]